MYQDIFPHVYHNEYLPHDPKADDVVLSYDGNSIHMKTDHDFYHYEDIQKGIHLRYLFRIDDISYYLGNLKDIARHSLSVMTMRFFEPKDMAFAGITGWQLYLWYRDNQYCGRCGKPMVHDLKERAMRCPSCGNMIYPKIMPAVIVGVLNDKGQILVTKYAHGSYQNYALVAGFAEIGETIEETVKREVKEETGLVVTDLVYYKSQPWSFSQTILFGFWCRAHGDQKIIMQEDELRVARWADRNEDIAPKNHAALTAEMIRMYLKGEIS